LSKACLLLGTSWGPQACKAYLPWQLQNDCLKLCDYFQSNFAGNNLRLLTQTWPMEDYADGFSLLVTSIGTFHDLKRTRLKGKFLVV
jgi:hypothetical protein